MNPLDKLTERQRQIAIMVRDGYSNDEIGRTLNITSGHVANCLVDIYRSLGINGKERSYSPRVKLAVIVANDRAGKRMLGT